jgi:hypothetical protein
MSDPRYEFDDDPDDPRSVKGGFPVWLILLLGGLVTCLFLCAGLTTVALVLYRRDVARQEMMEMEMEAARAELQDDRSTGGVELADGRVREIWREWSLVQDEFRAKVAGKSMDEVNMAVGEPDSTEERSGNTCWVYELSRQKPDKPLVVDQRAVVTFRNGRVAEVTFE